jgi:hypothetical protein
MKRTNSGTTTAQSFMNILCGQQGMIHIRLLIDEILNKLCSRLVFRIADHLKLIDSKMHAVGP